MMPRLSGAALLLSGSLELSLLAKATLVVAIGLIAARFADTACASVRHLVIATSFIALAALPVLMISVPALTIDVPVASTTMHPVDRITMTPAPIDGAPVAPNVVEPSLPAVSPWQWLRVAWVAGAIAFLFPVASALWRLSMIRRTGLPLAWPRAELARLADARGVCLPVELLEHEAVPGPMTFGLSHPVIVLPPDASERSEAELRCALMHELEHIQRRDWLMQMVARTVAAFYWFHPMVWTAWRRLCLEAERSCDDAVVISEERTEYAEQLVTLAQRMSATPAQPMLGMANRSDLSTRVTAVLDDRLRRGRAGFMLAAGTVAAAAIVVVGVAPVRAISTADTTATIDAEQLRKTPSPGLRTSHALDVALFEAAREGDLEGVKELLEGGANAGAIIDGDGSPLMGAAEAGRIEILRLLLDAGADPNGVVEGDGSPLIKAAQRGILEQVQLLIDRGADVNLAVKGDENPLMGAAEGGHLAIVQLLVSRGADIHTRIQNDRYDGGTEWRTAIGQARRNGHGHVVKYLESLGAR